MTLVHLAGWSGPLLLFALMSGRLHGIPVTVESDTQMRHGLPWWKRSIKRAAYPALFRCVSRFLPAGSRQQHYLRYYGVPDGKIRIARMTVDVEAIRTFTSELEGARREGLRARFGAKPGTTIFLFVGRLEREKGLDVLFAAFRAVAQDALLVVAGGGSLGAEVAAAARSDPRVHAVGRLSGEALLEVFGIGDVLVLPSRVEPWGLVVNEALAAGLPVIVSEAVGSSDDLVQQDRTGLVVPAGDAEALAAAMARLAVEPDTRRAMAERGRALISNWRLADEAAIIMATWKEVERG